MSSKIKIHTNLFFIFFLIKILPPFVATEFALVRTGNFPSRPKIEALLQQPVSSFYDKAKTIVPSSPCLPLYMDNTCVSLAKGEK
jgi:hypothetical protein